MSTRPGARLHAHRDNGRLVLMSGEATFQLRQIDGDLKQRYVREGFWDDQALGAVLSQGLCDAAAEAFTVRSDRNPYRGTLGEVDALARRVATGLHARGVRAGDAVAFQLP